MDLVGVTKPCSWLKGISQNNKINMDLVGIPEPCLWLTGIHQSHRINMDLEIVESTRISQTLTSNMYRTYYTYRTIYRTVRKLIYRIQYRKRVCVIRRPLQSVDRVRLHSKLLSKQPASQPASQQGKACILGVVLNTVCEKYADRFETLAVDIGLDTQTKFNNC